MALRFGRWAALQRRQTIARICRRCVERREGCARRFDERCCLRDLQRRDLAGAELFVHQRRRAFEQTNLLGRDLLCHLGTAEIDIGLHRVGDDGDLQSIERGSLGIGIGAGSESRRAQPAKQIDIPTCGQRDVIVGGRHQRRGAGLVGWVIDAKARFEAGLRQAGGLGLGQRCARTVEIGVGNAQIGVGGEAGSDELVEHRVVIKPPPIVGNGRDRCRRQAGEAAGRAGRRQGGRWRGRGHAGGKRQSDERGSALHAGTALGDACATSAGPPKRR